MKHTDDKNVPDSPFFKSPLSYRNSIPIFSESDEYIKNYEKISYDHVVSTVDGKSNPWIEESVWKESEDSTASLLKKYSKDGQRILDVGIGLGRLLSRFPNLERYGMDITFSYLVHSQTKGINVCFAKIEDMPYKEQYFDLIVCTDVLEHVFDLNLAVAKILSVLKKGGVIIVRVPNQEDLSQYLKPEYPYNFAHLRNFDENSLRLFFTKIFNCAFLEKSHAIFLPSTHKLKYKFPIGNSLIVKTVSAVRHVSKHLHHFLCKVLFISTEINVVFRKA